MPIGKNKRKGQVWSLDFVIASVLFIAVVLIYFKYSSEYFDERDFDFEELQIDANSISDSILTPGYPRNWNLDNVKRIGISDDGYKINESKLFLFLNFSSEDYNATRYLFGTTNHYYFLIKDSLGDLIAEAGRNGSSSMLASAERIVLYNSTLYRMSVYSWRQ